MSKKWKKMKKGCDSNFSKDVFKEHRDKKVTIKYFLYKKKEQYWNNCTLIGSLTNKIEIIEMLFFQIFISSILEIYKKYMLWKRSLIKYWMVVILIVVTTRAGFCSREFAKITNISNCGCYFNIGRDCCLILIKDLTWFVIGYDFYPTNCVFSIAEPVGGGRNTLRVE